MFGKMNKPEKKEYLYNDSEELFYVKIGYNQAIDDYEKFLPNGEEILELIMKQPREISEDGDCGGYLNEKDLAKAIAKRIGKEER